MTASRGKTLKRNERFPLIFMIAAFVIAVSIGIAFFLSAYHAAVDDVLYRERLSQMREVTTQLFAELEEVVNNLWDDVDIHYNYLRLHPISTTEELQSFMEKQVLLHEQLSDASIVAVDERGCYFTQEGWQGSLEEMDYLANRPAQVSFVSKSMTSDKTSLYLLRRLDEDITVQDGDKTLKLSYYGISRSMAQLNPYFSCTAYRNSNSVYVLDEYGSRLFRSSGSGSLLQGFHSFGILQNMEYLHETSFEEAERGLREKGVGYSNAVLDGEEYYYALYRMKSANWILLFMVPSSYVAADVVTLAETIGGMITTLAIALLAVGIIAMICVWHYRQSRLPAIQSEADSIASVADPAKIAQPQEIGNTDLRVTRGKAVRNC